jgi:2,3-bisphosphoglycerate-independent phosphoglycerate mutase
MGNSEVGHLNIGAGRVVYQDLVKVNVAIRDKSLHQNPAVLNAINYCKANHKKLHLIGLVSDGGVHSHINHLEALCDIAQENKLTDVFIHAFTDGRDTDPKGGLNYLNNLNEHLKHSTGKIASVIGRYYAMDRDKRWERIKIAYDLLVNGIGHTTTDYAEAIKASYADGITDEFIKPIIITGADSKHCNNSGCDAVICFNRTMCRRSPVLTQSDFQEQICTS